MNFLHTFTGWVATTSLRATLLVLLILAIQSLARPYLPARWRYGLWLPALLVLLTPVFPESRWSLESLLQAPTSPAVEAAVEKTVMVSPPTIIEAAASPLETAGQAAVEIPITVAPAQHIPWSTWLEITWLAGFASLLTLGLFSYQRSIRRFRQQAMEPDASWHGLVAQLADEIALRRVPEIVLSTAVPSPAVTGILRPLLLLPTHFGRGLSAEETRLVLKHELMHVKRGDLKMNFLLCLLMTVHWFNPLLWLAFFRSRTDREAACDAQVLHLAPQAMRHAYGTALLKIESAFSSSSLSLGFVGIFQKGTALRHRVRTLAEKGPAHPAAAMIATLLMALMLFLGMTQVQSPDAAKASFQIGQAVFRTGDLISIKSCTRDDQGLTVSGDYELVTQDSALLMLDVTQTKKNPGPLPAESSQRMEIQKGRGSFTLKQPHPPEGLPHVTFYGRSAESESKTKPFGAVYFGSFAEAEASLQLQLGYLMSGWTMQNFSVGQAAFRLGDSIQITSMTRNADVISVSGAYTLATEDTARLSLYITGDVKKAPFDSAQEITVKKGSGTFTLSHPKPYPGLPHLTFYRGAKTAENGAFGTLYFGSLEEAKASRQLNLSYLLASGSAKTARVLLEEKMNRILMPNSLTLGMSLKEAVDYLQKEARKLDAQEPDPAKRGVKIWLNSESKARMSVLLKDMSLKEAVRHLTAMSGTRYRLADDGIHIEDAVPFAKNPTLEKLKNIILPQVDFNEVTLEEAVDFLQRKSRIQTTEGGSSDDIHFVIREGVNPKTPLTLSLKNVPMLEVVRYITDLAGVKFRIEGGRVIIAPPTAPAETKPAVASAKTPQAPPKQGQAAERAKAIILPQVNFAGATVPEAVEFFRSALMNREDTGSAPVNIVLKPGGAANAQLSLELRDVPLFTALRYVAELSNCTLSSDDHSLILEPQ